VNQTRWTIVVACVAFALASARSWAETKSGFNLNPFAKSSDSKPASSSSSKSSSGFKLPSLWPASDQKKVRKRPTQPSAWDKFTNETKSMFEKTTDAITFWDNDKPSGKSKTHDSVRSRYGVKKKEEEKKSFFPNWFSSKDEEPKRPKTVSEFLNQDKPQP
jgi:hypothetical protein